MSLSKPPEMVVCKDREYLIPLRPNGVILPDIQKPARDSFVPSHRRSAHPSQFTIITRTACSPPELYPTLRPSHLRIILF